VLLRSIEYLADDAGNFDPDRSLTWADVFARDAAGNVLEARDLTQMVEMALRLYSGKNTLETCTRTVYENTDDSPEAKAQIEVLRETMRQQDAAFEYKEGELEEMVSVCPVKAVKKIFQAYVEFHGQPPPKEAAVFSKKDGSVLRRGEISEWLKTGAEACGIPKAKVASHSLRRGGASAYVAAGLSDDHICRFGRWTSLAYKAYVYAHAGAVHAALKVAATKVPRFEMN